jgi:hypothetical protein
MNNLKRNRRVRCSAWLGIFLLLLLYSVRDSLGVIPVSTQAGSSEGEQTDNKRIIHQICGGLVGLVVGGIAVFLWARTIMPNDKSATRPKGDSK